MFHFQYRVRVSLSLDFYDFLYIVAFFFFLICLEVVVDFTSFYLGVLDLEHHVNMKGLFNILQIYLPSIDADLFCFPSISQSWLTWVCVLTFCST